jgi:carboxypeptidase PM20D1
MSTPVERFQRLLRIPTISRTRVDDTAWEHFDSFTAAIAETYPLLHAALDIERVAEHSLLYRWKGGTDGVPSVLMAHYDVVPASDEGWEHPPFAAELTGEGAEARIWARGSIDNKGSLGALLEAVERLVGESFVPESDVYIFAGHNEETAGDGATTAVETLAARGIRPAFVLDEGGAVVEGIFPGVTKPAAVVGVSEKGIMSLILSVEQEGGHASTPPKFTATARLARAVTRLNRRPFPAGFSAPTIEMIETLGAHASGGLRWVFTHTRLTKPLLLALFSRLSEETSAMVRTTQAVTQLSGSAAPNVLAERAMATVNIRIATGSSVAASVAHVRKAINDPLVVLTVTEDSEPSPVSPTTGEAWERLSRAIVATYPGTVVTPYTQLGASDSRRFTAISDHVYRFTPFELSKAQRGTLHAINENIGVETWLRGIEFYERLVREL